MCFSSVLVRHITYYSHTVMYLLFSLLLHCCHPSSRIDFDWTGFPNLHRVDKHGEICLALANTGRKGAVQGSAGLGRWGRVLLPKAVGWDSRKLWGISATLHPFPCSLGTLLLAAAAECRSTKEQWVGQTKNHSDLFFFHRQYGHQTISYKLLPKAASCFSFVVNQHCTGPTLWIAGGTVIPHCNCAGSLGWAITFHCSFIWDSFNYMGGEKCISCLFGLPQHPLFEFNKIP